MPLSLPAVDWLVLPSFNSLVPGGLSPLALGYGRRVLLRVRRPWKLRFRVYQILARNVCYFVVYGSATEHARSYAPGLHCNVCILLQIKDLQVRYPFACFRSAAIHAKVVI